MSSEDDHVDSRITGVHPRSYSGDVKGTRKGITVCVIDMNNGHVNQAMRCFRNIVSTFFGRVAKANPGLPCRLVEVSPRDTQDPIPRNCDFYIGSGGPGSPYDGDDEPWFADFGKFCDEMVIQAKRRDDGMKSFFGVCHTYEMLIRHFRVADMVRRESTKFGVMPAYTTEYGQSHPLLNPFKDRIFAFEHRNWEAIHTNEKRLLELGGHVLAQESRDGHSKGQALLGVEFSDGIEGVQFHPEADRAGVMSWVSRPEQSAAFRETYGEGTFQAMLRTLDDPNRLARTYAMVIPGYLRRRFNLLAQARGYSELGAPTEEDVMAAFVGEPAPAPARSPAPQQSKSAAV